MSNWTRVGKLFMVTLGAVGHARGQSFNLDVGPEAPVGAPGAGYGAAAGQPGRWFKLSGGPPYAFTLNDLTGNPTAVTSHCAATGNGQGDFYFDNPISQGNDEKLVDDIQDVGTGSSMATWTFSGLQNGFYLVYTYAIAPDDSTYRTFVTSPATGQTDIVGGVFPNGHQENVTYSLHCVEVTDGELVLIIKPAVGFGTCNGFQLVYRGFGCTEAGTAYCDCAAPGSAPCGNEGAAEKGCANSQNPSGAHLSATGTTNPDTVVLHATGAIPGQAGLFFQGESSINGGAGVPFGDGLRCAGVGVVRLEIGVPDGNGVLHSTVSIGTQGGVGPGSGERFYQLWYRDPTMGPCGSGFNLTNGRRITW